MAVLRGWAIDDLDRHEDTLKGYHSPRGGVVPLAQIFPKEEGDHLPGL